MKRRLTFTRKGRFNQISPRENWTLPSGSNLRRGERWKRGPEVSPFPSGCDSGGPFCPPVRTQPNRLSKHLTLALLTVWLTSVTAAEPISPVSSISQQSNRSKARAQDESSCRTVLELAGSTKPPDALPTLPACRQFLVSQKGEAANPLRWDVAKALVKMEKFSEAASLLETIHDEPQEGARQKILGLCYAKASRVDDAIQCFGRAISLNSQDAEAHFNLGVLLSGKKEVDAALAQLGEAVNLDPGDPKYSLALAEALIDGKRYPIAVEFLNAVRSRFEKLGQFHYTLGLAYYGQHNAPAAIEEMQKATELDPRMEAAFYFLGNTYALAEQYDKALDSYRQAVELNSNSLLYYSRMALVAGKLGNSGEVISSLQQVVRLDPNDVVSRLNLAKVLAKTGRVSEAIEQLRNAVQKAPNYKEAYYLLSSYSRQIGDIKAADAYIETYRQLAGKPSPKQ